MPQASKSISRDVQTLTLNMIDSILEILTTVCENDYCSGENATGAKSSDSSSNNQTYAVRRNSTNQRANFEENYGSDESAFDLCQVS
jgi:hypothetical protein